MENLTINKAKLHTKIIDKFENLIKILRECHRHQQIVQCHGVFDLLHVGHIKHFQKAKELGDILIVTITPDHFVNKGPDRPYFTETLRVEAIAALGCVDYVIINQWPTAVEAIQYIRPHIYVKGFEYQDRNNDLTGKIVEEEKAIHSVGGKLLFTHEQTFSSSSLINQFFSPYSSELNHFLKIFRQKYSFDDILFFLNKIRHLNVLLMGESIIDIYNFCNTIGKSGKEPILAVKYNHEATYAGGILAIANHISSFCKSVTCFTYLGEKAEHQSFIETKLKANISLKYIQKTSSPTIAKTRYLDEYFQQKLFEVYQINDDLISAEEENEIISELETIIQSFDLVIVADYGHGLMSDKLIHLLTEKAKFLAVNTQSNASNHGFNCISKYPKADFVCLANRELQLNFRQRHIDHTQAMTVLATQYQYKNILVTLGVDGASIYNDKEGTFHIPAFKTHIKDRVGAGDAVLGLTSLLVSQQVPAEIVGLVGNLVGSEVVNIVGNSQSIEREKLIKQLHHILK